MRLKLIDSSSRPDCVILLYRPPSCSGPQYEDVILKMKSVMFKLVSPLPNIIMLGDFNLPTMSWSQPGDCFISRIFCPFVESLFLQQFVNVPTRKKYILDLVFCNSELIDGIDICDTFISDHCLLTVTTFIPVCFTKYYSIVNPPSSIFEMLNFKRCDWLSLQCALRDINWGALFSLVLNEDYFNVFMREITKVCTKIVPKAKSTHCHISSFYKERKGMMKRRTKLRKSLLHSQQTLNKLMAIEEAIITSHINEHSHEEAIAVAKIKEDPNFFFRYAKRFSITKQEIGPFYSDNGSLTNDKKLICKLLLEQFNSAFSIPLSDKVVTDPVSFFAVSNACYKKSEVLLTSINFSEQMIIDAISEISASSAPGPDGIQASFWKKCAIELAVPLQMLFIQSLESGIIPECLKRAAIVPIFKSGDKSLPSNYRPISLTPILMKIFERVIRKQVTQFLTERGYLNSSQHGFREGRSCMSALLSVYDDLMLMFTESTCSVDMIYLDFSKAFDKVDHGVLLHKLRDMGIAGNLGIWFHSFLSNRYHFVRLPGGSSAASPVISGVPQGTVLGPLLFLILMSDIGVLKAKVVSFADDTRLYSKISYVEDCDSLQSDLNCVYDWAKTNNMVFNSQKFKYLSFSTNVSITSDYVNAYVSPNLYVIDNVNNLKDLGIIMSSNCSFEQHIIELCKRCTGLCGWILTTFSSRESTVMMTLFKSLVLSRLDYGSQLWSPTKIHQIIVIEKIQKAFTKHIKGFSSFSYQERLSNLKMYSLQRRRERYIIIYV